jgi:hypothetical protein
MPPAIKGIIATRNADPTKLGGRAVSSGGIATTADLANDCCANCCCTALSWQVTLAGLTLCTCAQMTVVTADPDGTCAIFGFGGVYHRGPQICFFDFAGDPNGTFCLDQDAPGECSWTGPGPNITVTEYVDPAVPPTGQCAINPTVMTTTTTINLQLDPTTGQIIEFTCTTPLFVDPVTGVNQNFSFFAAGAVTTRFCGAKCLEYPPVANVIPGCFVSNAPGFGGGATGGTATLLPGCSAC